MQIQEVFEKLEISIITNFKSLRSIKTLPSVLMHSKCTPTLESCGFVCLKCSPLDTLSIAHGSSFRVLCPPVTKCLLCYKDLSMCNKPTQVAVHTLKGPVLYSKYIYRCFGCCLGETSDKSEIRQDVYYHHDRVRY